MSKNRESRASEIVTQAELICRMLAGALGIKLPGDPPWFTPQMCDFDNLDAASELVKMVGTEYQELCRLAGVAINGPTE